MAPSKSKPKPASAAPNHLPPPPHLSAAAAQVWRETVANIATIDVADSVLLETFAAAVLRQRRIAAEIEAAPMPDTAGKILPLMRAASSTAAAIKGLARALGLNATGRQQPPQEKKTGGGKWDDL